MYILECVCKLIGLPKHYTDLLIIPYTADGLDGECGQWVVGKECGEHKPVVEIVLLQVLLRKREKGGGRERRRRRKCKGIERGRGRRGGGWEGGEGRKDAEGEGESVTTAHSKCKEHESGQK